MSRESKVRPSIRRFAMLVAVAAAVMAPAMVFRLTGFRAGAVIDTAVFGVAVLAAGFMLSWGAETAEKRIAKGLILAAVALVTVLPEYAVDMYYAFQAGKAPDSNYVHYAAANMTGANRLLIGIAWPLLVVLHWIRTRQRGVELVRGNLVEIGFLLAASVYAFVIIFKNRIDLWDTVILIALFGWYVRQAGRVPESEAGNTEDDEPGPAAALTSLSPSAQWAWMGGLATVAAIVILASAEPFAESIVASGRVIGIDEFLLIQWIAPLASEAPAIVIAVLFVLSGRAENGLATMISDKINQWTLLVGMLPLAMSVGAGALTSLPLDGRQHEEFFLTAAQSLFGVSLLLRLRFGLVSALVLASLFFVQIAIAFVDRNDPLQAIRSLTWMAWLYLGLAAVMLTIKLPGAWKDVRALRATRLSEGTSS